MTWINYFAYGSNMALPRFQARIPDAQYVGNFRLEQHALRWHKVGHDGSAKCDAYLMESHDDVILGVVFLLPESQRKILDRIEGVGNGYDIKRVLLHSSTGEYLEAFTYFATAIDPSLLPFCWYKQHVLNGAIEADLPDNYVSSIRRVEAVDDLDTERRKRELSVYRFSESSN